MERQDVVWAMAGRRLARMTAVVVVAAVGAVAVRTRSFAAAASAVAAAVIGGWPARLVRQTAAQPPAERSASTTPATLEKLPSPSLPQCHNKSKDSATRRTKPYAIISKLAADARLPAAI